MDELSAGLNSLQISEKELMVHEHSGNFPLTNFLVSLPLATHVMANVHTSNTIYIAVAAGLTELAQVLNARNDVLDKVENEIAAYKNSNVDDSSSRGTSNSLLGQYCWFNDEPE